MASKTRNASATKKKNHWKLWACLDKLFWVLNSHHSSLFTHHLKIPCLFGTITHFPSLNIFHTICGPHTCHRCSFYFFFFSFQYTNSLNPVKKKKKNPEQTEPVKKKNRTANPRKEKKRSKGGQKLRLWVSYVCLITILPLSYELWKLKTAKSCFQFHNS